MVKTLLIFVDAALQVQNSAYSGNQAGKEKYKIHSFLALLCKNAPPLIDGANTAI